FEAQQTVQNTQLRTRSQIAAEKGLGDVKHLSAAKLAEYHFLDNAFKLHPFRLAGGLLKGGGAWSKIGKSYEAFAEEFGKTKDQFIAAKLTLLKDSARQL